MSEDPNKKDGTNTGDNDGDAAGSGDDGGGDGGSTGGQGEFKTLYEKEKAKNDDIIKNRQAVKQKNELLSGRISELESQIAELQGSKGKEDRDSLLNKLREKDERIKDLETRERESRIKDVIFKHADKFANTDDVFQLLRPQFKVEVENGQAVVKPKDEEWVQPDDFIQQFLEKRPHLAKNPGKGGSNSKASQTQGGGAAADGIPPDFQQWPREKRHAWIRENKQIAFASAAKTLLNAD